MTGKAISPEVEQILENDFKTSTLLKPAMQPSLLAVQKKT
jgi:hypothetical protein